MDPAARRGDLRDGRGFAGRSVLRGHDLREGHRTLYLFVFDMPKDQIAVKGLRKAPTRVSVLGGAELDSTMIGGLGETPGILWIDAPSEGVDANATVLKLEFEAPVAPYLDTERG